MYVHINIWLQTVTYIATTIYLKKSYVYVEIKYIKKRIIKTTSIAKSLSLLGKQIKTDFSHGHIFRCNINKIK